MSLERVFLQRYWPPAESPPGNLNQLGGRPNLPPELPWPRVTPKDSEGDGDFREVSLDFLAQINLADLPEIRGRDALPASGMLYFFALALVNMPIAEQDPGAAQVLYWPGEARNVPFREIPSDAGWNLEQIDYAKGPVEEYRNPDGPRGILFPRCPVRLCHSVDADTRPETKNPWKHRNNEHFPRRVEDAVLAINVVRNKWLEGLVPLSELLGHRRKEGFSEAKYETWRQRAVDMTRSLLAQGRSAMLEPDQRSEVRHLLKDGDDLLESAGQYKSFLQMSTAALTSLATLLLDMPDVALDCAEEIAEAAPPSESLEDTGAHWMLGGPREVQGNPMEGKDPILLLQLGSDSLGPRFQWWDCGTLTFWIEQEDVQAGRFERARAEIYGH